MSGYPRLETPDGLYELLAPGVIALGLWSHMDGDDYVITEPCMGGAEKLRIGLEERMAIVHSDEKLSEFHSRLFAVRTR